MSGMELSMVLANDLIWLFVGFNLYQLILNIQSYKETKRRNKLYFEQLQKDWEAEYNAKKFYEDEELK